VVAAATAVAAAVAGAAAVAAAATGKPPAPSRAAPIKQPHAGRVHEVLPVFLWRELSAFSKDLRMTFREKRQQRAWTIRVRVRAPER
jgi:hypothetical protein